MWRLNQHHDVIHLQEYSKTVFSKTSALESVIEKMRFSGTVFTGSRVHVWTVGQLGEKNFPFSNYNNNNKGAKAWRDISTYKSSKSGILTNELNITWRVFVFCNISTLQDKTKIIFAIYLYPVSWTKERYLQETRKVVPVLLHNYTQIELKFWEAVYNVITSLYYSQTQFPFNIAHRKKNFSTNLNVFFFSLVILSN